MKNVQKKQLAYIVVILIGILFAGIYIIQKTTPSSQPPFIPPQNIPQINQKNAQARTIPYTFTKFPVKSIAPIQNGEEIILNVSFAKYNMSPRFILTNSTKIYLVSNGKKSVTTYGLIRPGSSVTMSVVRNLNNDSWTTNEVDIIQ